MSVDPVEPPDNGLKKRVAIAMAALLIVGSAVLDAMIPGLVDEFIIVYIVILSIAVIWWIYLDAAERPIMRPNALEVILALLFLPFGLGLYLTRSRSVLRGLGLLLATFGVAIALYGIGYFSTSGLIRLIG